jgi:hypothetical protein
MGDRQKQEEGQRNEIAGAAIRVVSRATQHSPYKDNGEAQAARGSGEGQKEILSASQYFGIFVETTEPHARLCSVQFSGPRGVQTDFFLSSRCFQKDPRAHDANYNAMW